MYHYLDDRKFLHHTRKLSGEIARRLCHYLKEYYDIGANFYLVGSGAKNLILQNAGGPVDLDYNLEIVRCENDNDCRCLKERAKKAFNRCLQEYGLPDCEDSTSSLTSKKIYFNSRNHTGFSIDICITKRDVKGNYYRLIHEKTGWSIYDKYLWNKAPQSKELEKKVKYIKGHGKWESVRRQYLNVKNTYLTRNDSRYHPSFVCYIEAVNNVYNSRARW